MKTKNEMKKKMLAVLLGIITMFSTSIVCFADTAADAVPFRMKTDTNYVLNAYTSSTPINGTKVSVYKYDGDATQKFYTNGGYLFCAKSDSSLRVAYSYQNAIFRPVNYDPTLAHFSVESDGNYVRFYLDQIENQYDTLTGPLNYTVTDNQVKFQADSQLNNQRWRIQ